MFREVSEVKEVVEVFQSPRSGKFESNNMLEIILGFIFLFQSPRSGKFESNATMFSLV